jgi:hypothetical protein
MIPLGPRKDRRLNELQFSVVQQVAANGIFVIVLAGAVWPRL